MVDIQSNRQRGEQHKNHNLQQYLQKYVVHIGTPSILSRNIHHGRHVERDIVVHRSLKV